MQPKVSSSPSGVKKIHYPSTGMTLCNNTISALVRILAAQGTHGINIWREYDKEVEQTIYHCEVGSYQFQSHDLMCCILQAGGESPMKRCSRCTKDKPLDCFPENNSSHDGHGYYCNLCNRTVSK